MTCLEPGALAAFADGSISIAQRASALAHLAECASCRRTAAELVRGAESSADATTGAIGRYVLEEPLGAGAMGVVFRAHDPLLDRAVAIKVVDGQGLDDAARDRLLQEAKAMARVTAPGVVACYDAGFSDGDVFVAMELVEGTTLRTWAETRPDSRRVIETMLDAARGLAAAHAAGLVHRDVKPDNVLVRPNGRAAIGDFGLARAQPEAIADGGFGRGTRAAGTPRYLAPEVREGQPATTLSDQFAFCLTLLEVITGDIDVEAPLPPRLRAILARGLARSPADRWPSMSVLAGELERALRPAWRRPRVWAISIAPLLVLAGVLLFATSEPPETCTPPDLASRLYTPVARGMIAALATPTQRERVDRLISAQLVEHRALWVASCKAERSAVPDRATRACLDDAADTLARFLSAFRAEPSLAPYLVANRYRHLQVEACRPGMTKTLARPARAGVADLVTGVRRRMLHVDAALQAGDGEAALALVKDLAWSEALGDRALTADLLMLRGIIDAWLDKPEAPAEIARSRELAATSGDDLRRARLLLSLGQFYAVQRNDVALARALVDEATPLVAKLDNRQLVGDLAYLQAALELGSNRLPAASAAIQRAYDAMTAAFGDARPEIGEILLLRGQIATSAADNDAALAAYTQVTELYASTYGPEANETLNARMNLAQHALFTHETERGKAEFRAVIAALENSDPSVLADAHAGLCEALYVARDSDARAACEHAVTVAEQGYGPTHPRTGVALFDLGQLLVALDDDRLLPEAIGHLRRAVELTEPMGGDQLALSRFVLARALYANHESPAEVRSLLDLSIPVLRHNTVRAQIVELVPQWYAPWRALEAFRHARR